MRSRLLSLSILASLAQPVPAGRTGGHVRGPLSRRPVRNAEGDTGASSGTGEKGTTGSADGASGGAKEEPLIPQSKVNEIAAKERRKAETEAAALRKQVEEQNAKLAAIEEEKRVAEEAKLSAAERAKREQERKDIESAKKIAELEARATRERDRRHRAMKEREASRLAASIADKLHTTELAEDVSERIASALVIEGDGDEERVVMRMGAEGDNEPIETAWPKFRDERLTRFFRQQQGTGANHGRGGAAGGRQNWQGLSPNDKIVAGLSGGTKK